MSWLVNSIYGDYSVKTGSSIDDVVSLCSDDCITFIDKNVLKSWPVFNTVNHIVVDATENTKTLSGVSNLINDFIDKNAKPKTKIIAIGGGVVQDVVGFIASIWCRGTEYILVPTTVLSQVDSCVGGKTSINHLRKNILGTFWPPKEILICTDFLSTLSEIDYWSGWGEWIKYNLLQNKIDFVIDSIPIISKENELMFIVDGLQYKIDIIQRDEFDIGDRKFLNFGHTFGHAIESVSNWLIPHGYAIFIGCLISMYVSNFIFKEGDVNFLHDINKLLDFAREYVSKNKINNILKTFDKQFFINSLIDIASKSDKKQDNTNGLKMILIDKNGPCLFNVTDESVLEKSIGIVYDKICF